MDHPLSAQSSTNSPLSSPVNLAFSGNDDNPSNNSNNNESITNYLRYGSIRPPVSVLQEEFLYQYRLWKEYSEPLYGIENNNYYSNNTNDNNRYSNNDALSQNNSGEGGEGGEQDYDDNSSSDDSNNNKQQYYEKCMASIRTMYTKYSRQISTQTSGHDDNNNSSLFFESRYAEEKVAASEEEEEEKLSTISSSNEPKINNELQLSTASSSNCHEEDDNNNNNKTEKEQLEQLCALLFRPGSKFVGTIDIIQPDYNNNNNGKRKPKTKSSYYELIIMEHDALDERGIESRGVLARHSYAGDEQCVFVKLSLIPIVDETGSAMQVVAVEGEEMKKEEDEEEEEESMEEEVVRSSSSQDEKDDDAADDRENRDGPTTDNSEVKSQLLEKKREKLTIQMEYVDGDNIVKGTWNHDTLSFHGTATKLSQGGGQTGEQNEIGGTIISGLISGHGSYFNEEQNNSGSSSGGGRERNRSRRSSSSPSTVQTRSFSLSPCTHLHTHGISPAPTPKDALSEALSRLILSAQADTSRGLAWKDLILSQDPTDTSTATTKHPPMPPDKKQTLLDEIASHDNYKLIHHRARTESLRREALIKLCELGSLIDFAELARKRNVAKRREKWRKRVRKYTPKVPSRHRLLQRRKDKSKKATMATTTSDVQKKKVQFYDHLASISWSELLEESSIQAERTCAIFRRQTALLDKLTFESDEYKAQLMADMRRNGLTIAASHAQWDQCIQMGRTVALGWSWFERGSWSCFERSAVVGNRCVYLLFQMHSRLENNHSKLEKAFRGADERLTNVQLDRIKNGSCGNNTANKEKAGCDSEGSDGDESAGLCGVCQSEMHEEGEVKDETNPDVCLPCSHRFHWKCLREWLHDHSQCPICRKNVCSHNNM